MCWYLVHLAYEYLENVYLLCLLRRARITLLSAVSLSVFITAITRQIWAHTAEQHTDIRQQRAAALIVITAARSVRGTQNHKTRGTERSHKTDPRRRNVNL